ncbi:nitrilase-related carbon-nitrogen hydrolase [Aurantimonas marina]|uniref:nitrilase-related carbon-nitrogen hydrolase n=1 Tax=Aurantimonas marina TaxID=2780508 RepID=UPI0019CFE024|nr:nitrilase-related carbon-nitrogen hydrolase [Aurantimonas marina]
MRVAAFQLAASGEASSARLAAIEAHVAEAKQAGATLAVFPELALPGYGAGEAIKDEARARGDDDLAALARLAAQSDVAIVSGIALQRDGAIVNAAVLLRPGEEPVVYAKRQLYSDYEKALFRPGEMPPPIVDIGGMKAGLLVCFDVEFPEHVRDLAKRGAEIVLVPTALPRSPAAHFIARNVIPVRAFENQVFVVYADWCGADERFAYQGLSSIAAPDGSRLAEAGDSEPAMLIADIDPGAFTASKEQNPYLDELRAV